MIVSGIFVPPGAQTFQCSSENLNRRGNRESDVCGRAKDPRLLYEHSRGLGERHLHHGDYVLTVGTNRTIVSRWAGPSGSADTF